MCLIGVCPAVFNGNGMKSRECGIDRDFGSSGHGISFTRLICFVADLPTGEGGIFRHGCAELRKGLEGIGAAVEDLFLYGLAVCGDRQVGIACEAGAVTVDVKILGNVFYGIHAVCIGCYEIAVNVYLKLVGIGQLVIILRLNSEGEIISQGHGELSKCRLHIATNGGAVGNLRQRDDVHLRAVEGDLTATVWIAVVIDIAVRIGSPRLAVHDQNGILRKSVVRSIHNLVVQ